jgi:hypothetical protein
MAYKRAARRTSVSHSNHKGNQTVIITVIASTDGHCLYDATSSAGAVLVERSRQPLLDAARALLAMSTACSTHALIMRHSNSTSDALIATTIAYAAGLEVVESGHGPIFRPWIGLQQGRTATLSSCG